MKGHKKGGTHSLRVCRGARGVMKAGVTQVTADLDADTEVWRLEFAKAEGIPWGNHQCVKEPS